MKGQMNPVQFLAGKGGEGGGGGGGGELKKWFSQKLAEYSIVCHKAYWGFIVQHNNIS